MNIFLSHSVKNEEIALKFAEFLESVNPQIEVFCSSEKGNIGLGKNFIEVIFGHLNVCDLFVLILTEEYYHSRFCMVELGVAYSYLYNKYAVKGEEYIVPFALYPVQKGQALSGTPLTAIQTGDLNDENDIKSFLGYLSEERGIHMGAGTNRKIHAFKTGIDRIILKEQNIFEMAKIVSCFDNNGIVFKKYEDIVRHIVEKNSMVINFNMNPYDVDGAKYPNFISAVLHYVDKINLGRYLDFSDIAEFQFLMTNFTNSLKKIDVEFKYSDNKCLLKKFSCPVEYGENRIHIPLKEMRSKALREISEICFVIHPEDVIEKEGMFQVGEISVVL